METKGAWRGNIYKTRALLLIIWARLSVSKTYLMNSWMYFNKTLRKCSLGFYLMSSSLTLSTEELHEDAKPLIYHHRGIIIVFFICLFFKIC